MCKPRGAGSSVCQRELWRRISARQGEIEGKVKMVSGLFSAGRLWRHDFRLDAENKPDTIFFKEVAAGTQSAATVRPSAHARSAATCSAITLDKGRVPASCVSSSALSTASSRACAA